MCGIVGYVGAREAAPVLLDGLRRLEYRGYDSAGLAVAASGALSIVRSVGKLSNLDTLIAQKPLEGSIGIGHTRWATHGKPSELNAHPHTDCEGRLALIHNGIIENHASLRSALSEKGHTFRSETDTEVMAHLIEQKLEDLRGAALEPIIPSATEDETLLVEAVRRSLHEVQGTYAIATLWSGAPNTILAGKVDSPLVIGLGNEEHFLASDVAALLKYTRKMIFLQDGEFAFLRPNELIFFNLQGKRIDKTPTTIDWDSSMAEKGGYRHYMLKEIYEQPQAVENTLRARLLPLNDGVLERESGLKASELAGVSRIHIVACGTACHAGMVGRYLLERFGRIPCQVEAASEFRYRDPIVEPNTLVIAISQSGETADTLAAIRLAKQRGAKVLAICNTVGSAISRAADFSLYTHCGPECGVASTKAFAGQLTALNLLTLHLAIARNAIDPVEAAAWADELQRLPSSIAKTLQLDEPILEVARRFAKSQHFLFIGRTLNFPTAMEGALKLKEISYIHAEGYAAGEMKHGPLALVDCDMPVLAIATQSGTFEKVLSNIEEAKTRGAQIIAIHTQGDRRLEGKADHLIPVPCVRECLSPIINAVPLQLLAYHIAHLRGCDVDQPRNLAKSVTVE